MKIITTASPAFRIVWTKLCFSSRQKLARCDISSRTSTMGHCANRASLGTIKPTMRQIGIAHSLGERIIRWQSAIWNNRLLSKHSEIFLSATESVLLAVRHRWSHQKTGWKMQQHYFHPCAPSTFSRAPQPGRTSSSENSLEAALHRPTSSATKNVLGVRRLWTGRADPCGAPRFLLPGTTTTGLHLEGETHSYCPSRLTVVINCMQTQKCAAEDPLLSLVDFDWF